MAVIIGVLYILLLFFNCWSQYVPGANYLDELICLLLMLICVVSVLKNGKIKASKQNVGSSVCILVVFVIGVISNVLYGYMTDISVIARDVILTFKFFFVYLCGLHLMKSKYVLGLERIIVLISKILIIIIFVFGVVSLFIDVGMGSEMRYGIRSYHFIYSHYTYLVYNEMILMSMLLFEQKNNLFYYVMSIITLMLTLRTKAFMAVAFFLFIIGVIWLKKSKDLSLKKIFKFRIIAPSMVVLYFVSRTKISEYLAWGKTSSIRVGMHIEGLNLANTHFPFGTGFGSYGTNISYEHSSGLYAKLSDLNYENLLTYGYATISDVYWPSIYAQFGYIGFLLFLFALIMLVSDMFNNHLKDNRTKQAAICMLGYLIIASIAEAIFSNATGAFSALFLLLIILVSNEKNFYSKNKENVWTK